MLRVCAIVFFLFPIISSGLAQSTSSFQLVPWKDEMFRVPDVLESRHDGDFLILDYRSARDINGRDAIPEKQAKPERVSTEINNVQQDLKLKTRAGAIKHFAVGKTEGASVIVVYFHGKGGSREQGVDDGTFGGNFNRIKNLAVRSGGLYLVPDIASFTGRGAKQIHAMLMHYSARSPGAPIILSCGSAGGRLCYQLARKEDLAPRLGGMIFLGSFPDNPLIGSAAWKSRVPIYIGHGSRDWVSYLSKMEALYLRIREVSPDYPIKFERFESGTHGTPIRMIDWRKTINWMLTAR
ncbi:MAG: hypothetical protein MI807_11785 [Verrucomicrobiales bacterium]|nr:hypothetical protein [Verrucomicrobiales bacterium]